MNDFTKNIQEIKKLKQELLGQINSVAQGFVNGHSMPMDALSDSDVLAIVKDLTALQNQLDIFLTAVEDYIKSEGAGIPGALEKMLSELEKLVTTIDKINTNNFKNPNVQLIGDQITVLVKALFKEKVGIIDRIFAEVPADLISKTLLFVKHGVGKTIANWALWIKENTIGGRNILAVLDRLKLTDEMLANAASDASEGEVLKPIKALLKQKLEAIEITLKVAKKNTTAEAPDKPLVLKNAITQEAKKVLIDGIDDQVRAIVEDSPNVLKLASDPAVQKKLGQLKDLKTEISALLIAVDAYLELPSYRSGIDELNTLLEKLASLESKIKEISPKAGEVNSPEANEVQQVINSFVENLKTNPAIASLIGALNKSYILSFSLFMIKTVDNILDRVSDLATLIGGSWLYKSIFDKPLIDFINNLKKTDLPQQLVNSKNESSEKILEGYFNKILGEMTTKETYIKNIDKVTLSDLANAVEDKELRKHIIDLDTHLDSSDAANTIRKETVKFILHTHPEILSDINRPVTSDVTSASDEFKASVKNALVKLGSNPIVKLVVGLISYVMNKTTSKPVTSSYEQQKRVQETTENIHEHVMRNKGPSAH